MNLEFAHIQENIAQCEAMKAGAEAWSREIDRCLPPGCMTVPEYIAKVRRNPARAAAMDRARERWLSVTSGKEIQPQYPTSAETPRGLLCVATDGERNGRLAWVPGIRP